MRVEEQRFSGHWYGVRRVREEAAHVMAVLIAPWLRYELEEGPLKVDVVCLNGSKFPQG
jgi:hypothetical protein